MLPSKNNTPDRRSDLWAVVRKCPRLSGEAKLAWLYLFGRVGGPDRAVVVTAGEVSIDQGTGDRSGRRALDNLAAAGFIDLRTERAPNLCQECAVEHDPADPHNQQSLYYRLAFEAAHGRPPTWSDAMAHCDPDVQAGWRRALVNQKPRHPRGSPMKNDTWKQWAVVRDAPDLSANAKLLWLHLATFRGLWNVGKPVTLPESELASFLRGLDDPETTEAELRNAFAEAQKSTGRAIPRATVVAALIRKARCTVC